MRVHVYEGGVDGVNNEMSEGTPPLWYHIERREGGLGGFLLPFLAPPLPPPLHYVSSCCSSMCHVVMENYMHVYIMPCTSDPRQ